MYRFTTDRYRTPLPHASLSQLPQNRTRALKSPHALTEPSNSLATVKREMCGVCFYQNIASLRVSGVDAKLMLIVNLLQDASNNLTLVRSEVGPETQHSGVPFSRE